MSSLPSLSFGARPPLAFADFLKACEGLIPDGDMEAVRTIGEAVFNCGNVKNDTLKKWMAFEIMLRNELVKIRSSRKKTDPAKYLREDGCPESEYTAHMAINAYRKPSPLESEKALDLDRWGRLDELAAGHYFDMDALVIYACKLLILEKWHRIRSAEAHKILEEVLN